MTGPNHDRSVVTDTIVMVPALGELVGITQGLTLC